MNIRDMKLANKLYIGIGIIIATFVGVAAFQIFRMANLGTIQDEGHHHSLNAIKAHEMQVGVMGLYAIIGDAVINRNLAETRKGFATAKTEAEKDMAKVMDLVDTAAEKKDAEAFVASYRDYLTLFEKQQLPELEKGAAASIEVIRKNDELIDAAREATTGHLEKISEALIKDSEEGDALFDQVRKRATLISIVLSLLAAGAALLFGFFLVRNVRRQLGGDPLEVMEITRRVAAGDLAVAIDTRGQDEGSLIVSMEKMVGTLRTMAEDTHRLVQAAQDGKLDARADASRHQGEFRNIVDGINGTLDAVIGPLSVAAQYVERIAAGDVPPKITETYRGDFNEIKNNLNALIDAMNHVTAIAQEIAAGNLTVEVRERSAQDELMRALKLMVQNLQGIVGEVRASASSIAVASRQIAAGNADLSQRTTEQAAALEETASSMEELTSTVRANAENAQQANGLAVSANDVAAKGGEVIQRVVGTMENISESSRKIADIIGVIDGIAFQTNILALNAAVEAARAGEQGRGFAVVAGEVRNLAQRSAAAAKEIKSLIGDSVGKVADGGKLVGEAGTTMGEIVTSIRRVSDLVAEISAASQEQSNGIGQVNNAVTQMDSVTQQNAALVEEAAASAEALEEQAKKLVEVVGRFRVGNELAYQVAAAPPARAAAPPPARVAAPAPLKVNPPADRVKRVNGAPKGEKRKPVTGAAIALEAPEADEEWDRY